MKFIQKMSLILLVEILGWILLNLILYVHDGVARRRDEGKVYQLN